MSRDLPPRVTSRFKYSKATASPNKWLGVNGDCLLGKNPSNAEWRLKSRDTALQTRANSVRIRVVMAWMARIRGQRLDL
jgi:hypothetical protein